MIDLLVETHFTASVKWCTPTLLLLWFYFIQVIVQVQQWRSKFNYALLKTLQHELILLTERGQRTRNQIRFIKKEISVYDQIYHILLSNISQKHHIVPMFMCVWSVFLRKWCATAVASGKSRKKCQQWQRTFYQLTWIRAEEQTEACLAVKSNFLIEASFARVDDPVGRLRLQPISKILVHRYLSFSFANWMTLPAISMRTAVQGLCCRCRYFFP